jgi:DNA-binding MarR family transcriptional regulator
MTKTESNQESREQGVIVVAQSAVTASNAVRAIDLTGGQLIRRVGWREAPAFLEDRVERPVILLEAAEVPEEDLNPTLHEIVTLASARDLPLIVAFAEQQLDHVGLALIGTRAHMLCEPSVADRVTALLTASALRDAMHLTDLLKEDNDAQLARIREDIARMADVLARLTHRDEAPRAVSRADVADRHMRFDAGPVQIAEVPPAEIRKLVKARRLRDQFFGAGLFEDPAWDMLLDLYAAKLENSEVSVSSLCIASAVAPTTALRWIGRLTDAGFLERHADPFDRRRAYLELSDRAADAMRRYVAAAHAASLPFA